MGHVPQLLQLFNFCVRCVLAAVFAELLQLQLVFQRFTSGSGVVLLLTLTTLKMNFDS